MKIVDLFSGAGGMALGFEAAGAKTLGAIDVDPASAQTFSHMFAHEEPLVLGGPESGDISRLNLHRFFEQLSDSPDVVIGGPPCQDFSKVGRAKEASLMDCIDRSRRGARDPRRNQLYRLFLDAVSISRPLAFVMENVPSMRGHLGVDVAGRIATEATMLGYNVRYFLLNAAWYGVPQHRWRIFFVGLRGDVGPRAIPLPPTRTHYGSDLPSDGLAIPEDPRMLCGTQITETEHPISPVTVAEAIGDLPSLTSHLRGERPIERYLPLRRQPSTWAEALRSWPARPSSEEIGGNWYRFTPRDFRIFREMAHGDRYPQALSIANRLFREHLEELRTQGRECSPRAKSYEKARREFIPPYRNDAFDEKWRKLIPNQPSWTLTAHLGHDSYSHIHYQSSQARTISIREAARLQSFPDSFEFCGSFGSRLRQIGNAVPPLMARALANQLFDQLSHLATSSSA